MNILLINTNPVVSRLVSLCTREDDDISFEEVKDVTEVDGSVYDIVFVDDASYNDRVAAFSGWIAKVGKLVFLSGRDTTEELEEKFDIVVKKPFLPSEIQAVIDQVKEETEEREEQETESVFVSESEENEELLTASEADEAEEEEPYSTHSIFPLSEPDDADKGEENDEEEQEDEETVLPDPKVLDGDEIEQIKALLEDEDEENLPDVPEDETAYEARKIEVITKKLEEEGLEIVKEEEILSELSQTNKKRKKKSPKKMKNKEASYTMEEALLAAIENMKPKKIKKLLKGAEVTIKIRFKDDV